MRILALAILVIGVVSIGPAAAQTYDPAYPVCLHVYARGANYYECRYTSLPQCNATASGRAAQCVVNPYFAGAEEPAGYRRHRRSTKVNRIGRRTAYAMLWCWRSSGRCWGRYKATNCGGLTSWSTTWHRPRR
jgi:hypothetical protein